MPSSEDELPEIRITIGTRGSPLALAQAREVQRKLAAVHGLDAEHLPIIDIKTSGDIIQDRPLSEVGGKGLFTKEIEVALLSGDIDVAVHSMKDLETAMPDGLAIAAVLEREDVRDAFISRRFQALAELPAGAVIGTSSLRRRAQVKHIRPDLDVVEFRGNVQTRLRKLDEGIADATFLACAGLRRLGLEELVTAPIAEDQMLPAVAQGALALQIRADDIATRDRLAPLDHQPTALCTAVERAFLAKMDGSCRTPIAGLARLDGADISFQGQILRPDGSESLTARRRGELSGAIDLAVSAADELLERSGPDFLSGGARADTRKPEGQP